MSTSISSPYSAGQQQQNHQQNGGVNVIQRRLPRKPRPVSIAGTGMSVSVTQNGGDYQLNNNKQDKPPIAPNRNSLSKQSSNGNINSSVLMNSSMTGSISAKTPNRNVGGGGDKQVDNKRAPQTPRVSP